MAGGNDPDIVQAFKTTADLTFASSTTPPVPKKTWALTQARKAPFSGYGPDDSGAVSSHRRYRGTLKRIPTKSASSTNGELKAAVSRLEAEATDLREENMNIKDFSKIVMTQKKGELDQHKLAIQSAAQQGI